MNYWDLVSILYDAFENIFNKKVYKQLGSSVAEYIDNDDIVLECACGTGIITKAVSNKCQKIIATDTSNKMLEKASKNCKNINNISFEYADICNLIYEDETFDKVIAGNVIHLLDDPYLAIKQLDRVCKKKGMIIIPTYINKLKETNSLLVKILDKSGASFKKQFDEDSYKQFFKDLGYKDLEFKLLKGKMNYCVCIIRK